MMNFLLSHVDCVCRNSNMQFLTGLIRTLIYKSLALQTKLQCSRERLKRSVSTTTLAASYRLVPLILRFYLLVLSGKLVEKTMMRKYGIENINEHFQSFNTICDATQVVSSQLFRLELSSIIKSLLHNVIL